MALATHIFLNSLQNSDNLTFLKFENPCSGSKVSMTLILIIIVVVVVVVVSVNCKVKAKSSTYQ